MADPFRIKQGDTSPSLQYALTPTSVDLTGATVVFSMRPALAGSAVKVNRQAATIVTATGTPTVRYDWAEGDTDTAGVFYGEFEVTYSDDTVETFPNDGFILVSIAPQVA